MNVRLAAIDAIHGQTSLSELAQRLAELAVEDEHPIVRIALIDLVVVQGEPSAAGVLRRLAKEDGDPAVRDRATWAVRTLDKGGI